MDAKPAEQNQKVKILEPTFHYTSQLVQIGEDDSVFLLDFDRGQLREPGVWRQKNLARLHRSLQKIRRLDKRVNFSKAEWNELLEGYFSESRSA